MYITFSHVSLVVAMMMIIFEDEDEGEEDYVLFHQELTAV